MLKYGPQPFSPFPHRAVIAASVLFLSIGVAIDATYAGEPPEGYSSTTTLKLAYATGMLKLVDPDVPIPDSVVLQEGLEYGRVDNVSLKLDLYSPKNLTKPVPALVFIHGGGWSKGKRSDYRIYAARFAEHGYVVASISYRLRKVAKYPAAVNDAKCAVRWIRKNAATLNIDPNRIAAAGGSAGGHLSMMVGYSSDATDFEPTGGNPDVSSRVSAVVNLYGPVDLTTPVARSHSLVTKFIDASYEESPELYRQASPLTYVTNDDPPTLTFHGTLDDLVSVKQSDTLTAKLKKVGVETIYRRLNGWPHTMDAAKVVNDYCFEEMLQFFDAKLKAAKAINN